DLLFHIPFRYENFSIVSEIDKLQPGEIVTIKGTIEKIENKYLRSRKTIQSAILKDKTGTINIIWFNQPFLTRIMKAGDRISISGKVELDKGRVVFKSPDYEVIFKNT